MVKDSGGGELEYTSQSGRRDEIRPIRVARRKGVKSSLFVY
jgi:hypothetical protein